jgi:hypothetical protein
MAGRVLDIAIAVARLVAAYRHRPNLENYCFLEMAFEFAAIRFTRTIT